VARDSGQPVTIVAGVDQTTEPIALSAAYRQAYGRQTFWTNGRALPHPTVQFEKGKIIVTAAADGAFDVVEFRINSALRVYSVCYEVDPSPTLAAKDNANDGFVDITWPNHPGGNGNQPSGTGGTTVTPWPSGPMRVEDDGSGPSPAAGTPDGTILPGYQYELTVRTRVERLGSSNRHVFKEYVANFKVPRPSSTVTPYMLTSFPRADGFPHFRSDPIYLRTNRNYVHKLVTGFESDVVCQFRREGREIGDALPFRDNTDANSGFDTNTAPDRRGWGWGKTGDGHALTREEKAWMESYNRSVPSDRQITNANAIPDDVLFAYGINPSLLRAEFDGTLGANGAIGPFDAPVDLSGSSVSGRWSVNAGLLSHATTSGDATTGDSVILNTGTSLVGAAQFSVWLHPTSDTGRAGFILAAGSDASAFLTQYLLVEVDRKAKRIALRALSPEVGAGITTLIDKPLTLRDRWSRLQARLTAGGTPGSINATVQMGGDIVLSGEVQLGSSDGRVGLFASHDYSGEFDNFEAVSLDRLNELPEPAAGHELTFEYRPATGDGYTMHELKFVTSRFVDMFDMMNAWDRMVWRSAKSTAATTGNESDWTDADAALRIAITDLYNTEAKYARGEAIVDDLDAKRVELRDDRFALDEKFTQLATNAGFELSPRPDRFQFSVSSDGKALLLELPEPIDWARYGAGLVADAANPATTSQAKLFYSSDCTRMIVLLDPSGSPARFESGHRYLWTIQQWPVIQPHLVWLTGWVDNRRRDFSLTLDIPA
jgi:hypothetical protein